MSSAVNNQIVQIFVKKKLRIWTIIAIFEFRIKYAFSMIKNKPHFGL